MTGSQGVWRRLLLTFGLLVSASFVGVFLLGGAHADGSASTGATSSDAASLTSQESSTAASQLAAGHTLFVENCATCHGIAASGSQRAPNLLGVGAATVDLWVSSGWMPLAEPTAEPERKPPKFTPPQILEIVKYVTSLAPPGMNPGIPFNLDISHANVAEGFSLFALNCAPCHTITGAGDALADGIQAPPLHGVTKTMVWEAIRTGPGNMPRFGPGTITPSQVVDIVGYVVKDIEHPAHPGGLDLGGVGPVAEGFIGLFVGVGACLLAAFWVGDRTEKEDDSGHDGGDGHAGDDPDGHDDSRSGGDDEQELADAEDSDGRGAPDQGEAPHRVTIPVRSAVIAETPQYQIAAKNPRRAELAAAAGFLFGAAAFAGFGAAYWQNYANFWLGVTLAGGFAGMGYGMVVWGKYLMPRGPFSEARHVLAPTPEEREAFIEDFASRGKVAVERRGFLVKALGLASGILGVVLAFPLIRSLGPLPGKTLTESHWNKGDYLVDITGRKIKAEDIEVGGFITVFPPSDIVGAYSQTMLIHVQPMSSGYMTPPARFAKQRATWAPLGYIAFSKLCTHAGCPVGLYEELTERMLCPCHQSLFVVTDAATPIFGPAPRPLPQLPLYIDDEGYFHAQDGYDEPVGPGYWERGND